MCDRCGCDGDETPCDGCSMVESANSQYLRDAAPQMLEALHQALQWIERDEHMHGRPFGAGNAVRAAIAAANGLKEPEDGEA